MTDRPILFSGPMIHALLEGRKTMTRRLAWRAPRPTRKSDDLIAMCKDVLVDETTGDTFIRLPSIWQKVRPGDRLWVRETFLAVGGMNPERARIVYRASNDGPDAWISPSWRPSIHMPRWASRLTLVVTETKMERLQEIDGLEALAEGIIREEGISPWLMFYRLWNSIHGDGAWQANPEVVALTFTVHKANIDATP